MAGVLGTILLHAGAIVVVVVVVVEETLPSLLLSSVADDSCGPFLKEGEMEAGVRQDDQKRTVTTTPTTR